MKFAPVSKRGFFKIIKSLALLYFLLLLILYLVQDYMIFPVQKYSQSPADVGLTEFSEIKFTANDGKTTMAWFKRPDKNNPIYVYFAGNAESYVRSNEILSGLAANGSGVLALIYRGYGKSTDTPSEQGFYNDAQSLIDYIKSKFDNKIIVIGRSIGTGVAVEVAANNQLDGIVLWSPYTTLEEVAADQYPIFPIKKLGMMNVKFDSAAKIKKVSEPVLFIHGKNDSLIKISNAKQLFSLANEPKRFVVFDNADHINFNSEDIISEINKFVWRNKI